MSRESHLMGIDQTHCICWRKRMKPFGSALLHLRPTKGSVDALVHDVPVDLIKHLIDIARLCDEERALAVGNGLEELNGEAARAHLSRNPDPALAIVDHLLRLIDARTSTALCNEQRVLHLLLQDGHGHCNVLPAQSVRGRAFPGSRIALETLRGELAIKVFHDELAHNFALRRVASATRTSLRIERLDVRICDLILSAP